MQPIIPPYLLRRILQAETGGAVTSALKTLAVDTTLRSLRSTLVKGASRMAMPAEAAPHRSISSADHTDALPGRVVRQEGEPPVDDAAINEAYDALGATFDFYWKVYGRNSIDDEGLPLNATVHFSQNYDNAFWDGERMVFGDGDNEIFNRFTISLDVVGHELTHGVTQDEAQLDYHFQAGALNESVSDVFGSLIKQYALNQTADKADWLVGAGLFTAKVKGQALRSMKAPGTAFDDPVLGKDPQPASMENYVNTMEDNGGVHINSSIPNRAFYLAAIALGGYAWDTAGWIWYETLRDSRLTAKSSFRGFARLTWLNAQRIGKAEAQQVQKAWNDVGVKV